MAVLFVLVPGVLLACVLFWVRTMLRRVRPPSAPLGFFKRPAPRHQWAEDSFKMILEWQLRGLREREHTMLRIRSTGGTTVCRMASPARAAPVSVGDRVELRGHKHPDGILRVFKLYNLTTSSSFSPSFLAPEVMPLLLISVVLFVLAFDFLVSLSAA